MTENEIKEFVAEIRQKSDIFCKSGFATTGVTNVFDKSADIIEELLPYMAIGTVDEFKTLKEKKNVLPIATIKISKEDMQKMVDEKVAQIELNIQEIRAKAIDEFAERLKEVEQIATKCTLSQSDGYSQIMRICDEIAEQMKGK